MSDRATSDQKDLLRRLMRKAGSYDMRTVTLMTRQLGATDAWMGQPTDAWLDSLTKAQAMEQIKKLQGEE